MRVLIVGATGFLGQEITRQALAESHHVTAFVRDPARMPITHSHLRLVRGDILQLGDIDPAMTGQSAVVCSLGTPSARAPSTLLSEGTGNLIRAMRRHNARRLICVTGWGTGDTAQEELVRKCDRDWMVVRPARLTDNPARGRYGVLLGLAGAKAESISRADVAAFIAAQLQSDRYLYKTPLLSD